MWEHVIHPCASHTPNPRGQELLHLGPFWIPPCVSLHLAVHVYPLSDLLLDNKLVIVSVSMSSVRCYSKLLNLRRDHWNPKSVAKLTRSMSDLGTHYLGRESEVGSVLGDRSLNLWLWFWLQADGVRPELNCRSLNWRQRTGWCEGKATCLVSEVLWVERIEE